MAKAKRCRNVSKGVKGKAAGSIAATVVVAAAGVVAGVVIAACGEEGWSGRGKATEVAEVAVVGIALLGKGAVVAVAALFAVEATATAVSTTLAPPLAPAETAAVGCTDDTAVADEGEANQLPTGRGEGETPTTAAAVGGAVGCKRPPRVPVTLPTMGRATASGRCCVPTTVTALLLPPPAILPTTRAAAAEGKRRAFFAAVIAAASSAMSSCRDHIRRRRSRRSCEITAARYAYAAKGRVSTGGL